MTPDWPDGYDTRTDSEFVNRIRPFIEHHMANLAAFDTARAKWVATHMPHGYEMTYVFHEHAARVADDMRRTALHLGLPQVSAENLYWAMLPHDIGKTALPVHIWDTVEKPEDDIKRLRRSHTDLGVAIVDRAIHDKALPAGHPFVTLMRDIMLNHHEQMDGDGFHGLRGDALSAPVRLACIVESYDGYAIARPHFGDRDISPEGVLTRMHDEKGAALYDMDLFDAFAHYKRTVFRKGQ